MPRIDAGLFTLNVPTAIKDHADIEIHATLDLNTFGSRVINPVRRALETNMADFMGQGKAGMLYTALCQQYGLYRAHYAKVPDNYSKGYSLYIEQTPEKLVSYLETAQGVSKPSNNRGYSSLNNFANNDMPCISAWACHVPRTAVRTAINEHRPNDPAKVQLAVDHLMERRPVVFIEGHNKDGDDNA